MATADLKLIYSSGSGDLSPSFFSGQLQIATGSTGTLLTLTAPAGKLVRLTSLIAASTAETLISVTADSNTVISSLTLSAASGASTVGGFVIGVGMSSTPTTAGSGATILPFVQGSTITISKVSGTTGTAINYSYMYS